MAREYSVLRCSRCSARCCAESPAVPALEHRPSRSSPPFHCATPGSTRTRRDGPGHDRPHRPRLTLYDVGPRGRAARPRRVRATCSSICSRIRHVAPGESSSGGIECGALAPARCRLHQATRAVLTSGALARCCGGIGTAARLRFKRSGSGRRARDREDRGPEQAFTLLRPVRLRRPPELAQSDWEFRTQHIRRQPRQTPAARGRIGTSTGPRLLCTTNPRNACSRARLDRLRRDLRLCAVLGRSPKARLDPAPT